jgi:hypothetical protein
VLHADARAGRSGLVALPVRARDELVGVLVVDGPVRLRSAEETAETAETAEWVGEEERPRPHRPVLGSRKDGNRNDRPPATWSAARRLEMSERMRRASLLE